MSIPSRPNAPTLANVADLAGVSRQTVSNAINNPELLHPETLQRVLDVIAELGYQPNRAARSLRTRSSRLIGLRLEPEPSDRFGLLDRFVRALVTAAKAADYNVLLFAGTSPRDLLSGYDDLLRSTAV